MSLLLLQKKNGQRMADNEVKHIMLETARGARWPIELLEDNYTVRTVSHPKQGQVLAFATLIAKKIANNA